MQLLLIAPYVFLGSCLLQTTEDTGGSLLVVLALFGAVLLCNMVYAFLLPRLGFDGRRILFWNLLLKLCNIPVYLFVFAVALVTNVLIIPMLPFLFLFDYAHHVRHQRLAVLLPRGQGVTKDAGHPQCGPVPLLRGCVQRSLLLHQNTKEKRLTGSFPS